MSQFSVIAKNLETAFQRLGNSKEAKLRYTRKRILYKIWGSKGPRTNTKGDEEVVQVQRRK